MLCLCVSAVLDRLLPAVEHVRLSGRDQRQVPRQPDLETRRAAVQQVHQYSGFISLESVLNVVQAI